MSVVAMADIFCSFLNFRSLTTNYNLPMFLPSKHYCYSAFHSHSSRISGIKRRSLLLTLLTKSSSNFGVISTHEHSDGSLLFRFGHPSEVAENVKMIESKTVKAEIEEEPEEGYSVVKVVDNGNEAEGTAQKVEREVTDSGLLEVADHTNSIVSNSKTITVVEAKSEACEKLLEGSTDTELPALTSSKEMDREHIEDVEETLNEESEDSSLSDDFIIDKSSITTIKLENETSDVPSTSEEMEVPFTTSVDVEQTGNVKEGLIEEHQDSPVDASILDKSSEMFNNTITVALSEKEKEKEKETADMISKFDVDLEQTGNVEEGLDEEKHEESTPENAFIPDKVREVENNVTALEFSEKEIATTLVSLMTDPVIAIPDNNGFQASQEIVVTTDVGSVSEHGNVETEMQNEAIEDGRGSSDSNSLSQFDTAISLSKEIKETNLEVEMQNIAIGKSSEGKVNDLKALEMQNVVGNGNASEMYDAEVKSPPIEAAMIWAEGSEVLASGAGSGMSNETVGYVSEKDTIQLMTVPPQLQSDSMLEQETGVRPAEESREADGSDNLVAGSTPLSERPETDYNVQGGDPVEALVNEVAVLKSTESTPLRQVTIPAYFVLSSGAALLPHPTKVLTGGEDAYFVAGQTWLGVADGVGQWSLEGTTPGVYARELIKNCERLISTCNVDSMNNPVELLNLSVAETQSPGSATALIAKFDGQALHVANVGDSGFIVVRHGAVYKKSSPMHHLFNFPLQIVRGDDPSSLAELYRVDLEEADVIIIATDGLLDNLYDREISLIVRKSVAAGKKLEEIAELLATKAQEIGSSASLRSPFADDAQAAGFVGYSGGKLDDVAVIVSLVQKQSNSQTL